MRRRAFAVAVAAGSLALVVLVAVQLLASPPPLTDEQPTAAAADLARHVAVSAEVVDSALAVTRASADFGIEEGVRSVPVRIVDDLTVRIRIASDVDVPLAAPPRVCLVGPFWNPLDAGLSDRCWGEPDLARVVADRLAVDGAGGVMLQAGHGIALDVAISRGRERCDYAPGEWRLQVDGQPLVGGAAAARVDLADLAFEVPLEADGTILPFYPNAETRPCSYAAAVFTRQGEPRFEGS